MQIGRYLGEGKIEIQAPQWSGCVTLGTFLGLLYGVKTILSWTA